MRKSARRDKLKRGVQRAMALLAPDPPARGVVDGLRDAPGECTAETARLKNDLDRMKGALEEALLWLRAQDPDHAARILARALDDAGDANTPR